MSSMAEKIKTWVDNHRELIVLGGVLPVGTAYGAVQSFKKWRSEPDPAKHDERVARIVADVRRYAEAKRKGEPEGQRFLRTDRRSESALNSRKTDKSQTAQISMGDMRAILGVDRERGVVRVEPFATTGDVAKYLDDLGLQLEATIEMKGATMGGLVLAIGMTTHSHVSGLVHDTVEAFELVMADGELIRAERTGEHADLFRALPWSHGTLGMLVSLELRIVPAPTHVRLVYRPFFNTEEYIAEHQRLLAAEDTPWFLEGQVFGRDRAVLIEGYLATPEEVSAGQVPVNDVSAWNKPFFFKHVESMLEHGETREELVPNYSYLLRHERSMCMTMGSIVPTANEPWFRSVFGWMMPPNMELLKLSRPQEERRQTMRGQVYQDFAFPAERFGELLEHIDQEFEIYPLLVYPCRVEDRGGMVRLPGQHGKPWDGEAKSKLYMNLGIYGIPKQIREGNLKYPTVTKVRELEGMIRDFGGFLHTYVDVFSTEEEFEQMFDLTLWREMRERYNANGAFPTIYQKIKPEIDPLSFLDEEASWIADSVSS